MNTKKYKPIKYLLTTACLMLLTIGTVAMTACDGSRTPDFNPVQLSAPENIYLCHNQTVEDTTEYILKWDKVKNANSYKITTQSKTFTTTKTEYDLTNYCTVGKTTTFTVQAVSKTDNFENSQKVAIKEKAEEITKNLVYNKRNDGNYEIDCENATTNDKLFFPDAYDGKLVKKIIKSGFKQQPNLRSVRFPKYLTTIGKGTFSFSNFENLIIPEGITTIEGEAFTGTKSLKNITFPSTLTTIGAGAFYSCGMESIYLPDNLTTLSDSTFGNCTKLTNILLSKSLKAIPEYCFSSNTALENIKIPSNILEIGSGAFVACNNLKNISFENSSKLTTISSYAFQYCGSLTKITLPDSLQTIEPFAFENCDNLTSIHIPKGVSDLQGAALFNKAFTSFTVAEDNSCYKAVNGNIYSKDGTELVQYAYNNSSTEFTVPDGVTKIGDYAFYEAANLLTVHLPEGILEIGDYSFCNCAITEIDLPYGLTTIGEYAFACVNNGQTNLTEIVLPDSVTSFGVRAFSSKNLKTLKLSANIKLLLQNSFECLSISLLELPNGITLQKHTFSLTNLKQLILPKDLKKCEGVLFAGLFDLVIPDIFYKGSPLEWALLKGQGVYNDDTFSGKLNGETYYATIYFYSESEPPLNSDGTAYRDNYWHYAEDGITPVVWEL